MNHHMEDTLQETEQPRKFSNQGQEAELEMEVIRKHTFSN